MTDAVSRAGAAAARRAKLGRLWRIGSIEVFLLIGVAAVGVTFVEAVRDDVAAIDFPQFYAAAKAIMHGESPYHPTPESIKLWGGPYPYPPFPAYLVMPLTVLPQATAGLVVMGALVCVALAVPYVLGVRDWRCYGLMFVWPSTIYAIQTANVTLWFALAAAIAWRCRDGRVAPALSVGLTLATKFFLWPLALWFAATRRYVTAALAVLIGSALLFASWAVIGFAGFTSYPSLLRRLDHRLGPDAYTVYVSGVDLGLPSPAARVLWLGVGLLLLVLLVLLAQRGDELSAFVLAVASALALTPIVWHHYFALLLVVIALASPRLGLLWFVPLALALSPGSGHPVPWETAWTLAVASTIVVLALRATLERERSERSERSELPARPRHELPRVDRGGHTGS